MTNAFFIKWFPLLRDKLSKLALVKCLSPANCHSVSLLLSETKRCLSRLFLFIFKLKHLPKTVIQSFIQFSSPSNVS